jgi:hypothetical protein
LSLFIKPIKDISYDDIEAFCREGNEEGILLEYKGPLPNNKKIAKEIAAFANTYGGILLLGVNEEDRMPALPVVGVPYDEGLDEKISSIAFKSINPPLFPEIKICKLNDDESKAVIVVRVQESNDTPHRVEQDTKIYIRIASQSEPVLAPFGEIEWLMNRREKAITNKQRLLKRSRQRFISQFHSPLPPIRGISIIPLYPHKEIVPYLKLHDIVLGSYVKLPNSDEDFPCMVEVPITQQASIVFSETVEGDFKHHTEVSSFGLISYEERLSEDLNPNRGNIIDVYQTMEKIYVPLLFAKRFYRKAGFYGLVQINLFFERVRGRCLSLNDRYANLFDMDIDFERIISVSQLLSTLDEVAIDLLKELFWSFNYMCGAVDSSTLNGFLERQKNSLVLRGFVE